MREAQELCLADDLSATEVFQNHKAKVVSKLDAFVHVRCHLQMGHHDASQTDKKMGAAELDFASRP